jgi:5-formyltetrahydrofolate cyclo-ligase
MQDSAKSQLRQRSRERRSALTEADWQRGSDAICERLLQFAPLARAAHVALFWPLLARREPDLRPLDAALRARGKAVYYPASAGLGPSAAWGFALTLSTEELHPARGLLEPAPWCPRAAPGQIEVVVAPSLALDNRGYRLGYGAGFYDRVLAQFAPPAFVVGVCYASERVGLLAHEAHDHPVDWIVTDAESAHVAR